jgi:hypothetical protein
MANKQSGFKHVTMLNGTIATDATASAMVDRLGFDYAVVNVTMRPATATNSSAKWTVLKLQHSDTTAVSDATNISGFIGTTNSTAATTVSAAEFVIPANNVTVAHGGTAATGGGQTITLAKDLRGLKRYLFLNVQANASHQTATVSALLFKGEDFPTSTTERNVAAVVVG